jgi:hypothetical protein
MNRTHANLSSCLFTKAVCSGECGSGGIAPPISTSAFDAGERPAPLQGHFSSGENSPCALWMGDLVESQRRSLLCEDKYLDVAGTELGPSGR